jgi:hypothetical protein
MSLHEKDVQSFFQPTMVEGDVFNGKGEEPGVTEVAFPTNKVRSVCFWRPSNTQALAPVVFSQVTECSRFEKNQ